MRVFLLLGSSLKLRRESFQHRLVIQLEGLDQFFLGRSVTGADQLHDRDRRYSGCGNELDHDLGSLMSASSISKPADLSVRKYSSMVQRLR